MLFRSIDNHWTKSFPFESRYSNIQRQKEQNFNKVNATYQGHFLLNSSGRNTPNLSGTINQYQKTGLIIGTFGPETVSRSNIPFRGYSKSNASGSYFHRWAVDISTTKKISDEGTIYNLDNSAPNPLYYSYTGSCSVQDNIKVLFGFGDANTIVYSSQFTKSDDPTGYVRFGTNNWPEFRIRSEEHTSELQSH